VYVAVSLSWLTATLLFPAHERPFAIGSTDGSAWNAAFVFNGIDRLRGTSPEGQVAVYIPGHHYPQATQAQRDRIPIVPPSPTRLLARIGPLSGERLGLEGLLALILGVPALIWALREDPRSRRVRALAAGLSLWALTGIALFSAMARLHPRYVEGFTPALAALLGIGAAWAVSTRGRTPLAVLAGALLVTVVYAGRLLYGLPTVWWIALACALGAIALALLARAGPDALLAARPRAERPPGLESAPTAAQAKSPAASPGPSSHRGPLLAAGALAFTMAAVLAIPLSTDVTTIKTHASDAGHVGALPAEEQAPLSAYLRAHQGRARYEVAADSATQIGSLIVQDARPILVLTSYNARVFTNVARLRQLIARGEVRYAFINSDCRPGSSSQSAGCSAPARWVRAHGTDVSSQAGLPRGRVLWLLPGAA
jgi:hypothetical protein